MEVNSLYSNFKQTKMSCFYKTENRRAEQVLPGGWYQREGVRCWDMEWEGEYGRNVTYLHMQIEK
jgi:hypothetical protein